MKWTLRKVFSSLQTIRRSYLLRSHFCPRICSGSCEILESSKLSSFMAVLSWLWIAISVNRGFNVPESLVSNKYLTLVKLHKVAVDYPPTIATTLVTYASNSYFNLSIVSVRNFLLFIPVSFIHTKICRNLVKPKKLIIQNFKKIFPSTHLYLITSGVIK